MVGKGWFVVADRILCRKRMHQRYNGFFTVTQLDKNTVIETLAILLRTLHFVLFLSSSYASRSHPSCSYCVWSSHAALPVFSCECLLLRSSGSQRSFYWANHNSWQASIISRYLDVFCPCPSSSPKNHPVGAYLHYLSEVSQNPTSAQT